MPGPQGPNGPPGEKVSVFFIIAEQKAFLILKECVLQNVLFTTLSEFDKKNDTTHLHVQSCAEIINKV